MSLGAFFKCKQKNPFSCQGRYEQTRSREVCHLRRSLLYGLKQASRHWNHELIHQLCSTRFIQSSHDDCLFIYSEPDSFVALVVYVNGIIMTGTQLLKFQGSRIFFAENSSSRISGKKGIFLELKSRTLLHLSQQKHIVDLLKYMGLLHGQPVPTPWLHRLILHTTSRTFLDQLSKYRRLIGRLLYFGFTRSSITYGVQQLSQFQGSDYAFGQVP